MTTKQNDNYLQTKFPKGHISNLQASNNATTPNTKIDVAAGQCRNSENSIDIDLEDSVTINAATNGALGLDTGTFAADTFYYVDTIKDTQNILPNSALISESYAAPVLPTVSNVTYDAWRVVDVMLTDASAHFVKMTTRGNGSYREKYYNTMQATALTSGSPGTATTLTEIDLSASVPPIDGCVAILMVDFTPATANDKVSFAPFGSTATVLPHVTGNVATKISSGTIEVPVVLDEGVPKVLYINSAASGATVVQVRGFKFPV